MTKAVHFYILDLKFGHVSDKTLSIAEFDICQGNFKGEFGRLVLYGFYANRSKFVVLKHFGFDGSHKETSAPFLFTIYISKSVFSKDYLMEYGGINV